jgi:hypothetical protein
MPSELKQPCPILRVELIAEYLGCTPNRARTALRNLADGNYAVEVDPGQWVRVISVPVERMVWTPAIKQEGE